MKKLGSIFLLALVMMTGCASMVVVDNEHSDCPLAGTLVIGNLDFRGQALFVSNTCEYTLIKVDKDGKYMLVSGDRFIYVAMEEDTFGPRAYVHKIIPSKGGKGGSVENDGLLLRQIVAKSEGQSWIMTSNQVEIFLDESYPITHFQGVPWSVR